MSVSQKCQYALRAVLELAKRPRREPTTAGRIATAQAIPARFLELILGQLRQGGYVTSRRGAKGGFSLAVEPSALSVGEIIRFVDGPIGPVRCVAGADGAGSAECPLYGSCAFMSMWSRARDAVAEVYDTTKFSDLIEAEQAAGSTGQASYCI